MTYGGPTSRNYYTMPIDFTVHYTDLTTETFTHTNDQRTQTYQLLTTKEPDYTVFDEDSHILKVAEEQLADSDGVPGDGDDSGIPGDNPCSGGETEDCDDSCPDYPNGPDGGTCTRGDMGIPCMTDGDCGTDGFCSVAQEDTYPPGGNGCGDACDCEGNFDNDDDQDGIGRGKIQSRFREKYL